MQTESLSRTPIDVTPDDFTALNAYSAHTERHTAQAPSNSHKFPPDLTKYKGAGKKRG
jgi:hypothetical protein